MSTTAHASAIMTIGGEGDTAQFAKHLQGLPQELYDKIYNLTFSAIRVPRATIDSHYRPPATLQVDQASRELFANVYYSTCNFRFRNMRKFTTWVRAMTKPHLRLINHMTYDGPLSSVNATAFGRPEFFGIEKVLDGVQSQVLRCGVPASVAMLVKVDIAARRLSKES